MLIQISDATTWPILNLGCFDTKTSQQIRTWFHGIHWRHCRRNINQRIVGLLICFYTIQYNWDLRYSFILYRSGGARIYYIFNNVFGAALDSIQPGYNLSIQDIRTAIRNSTGPRPFLFVPEIAFDLLVRPQIQLLEPPSIRCVELVYEELIKICHNCGSKVFPWY